MLGELMPTGGGDPIPLLKPKLLIGRRDDCDITLKFPNVSSHHCELELREGYWFIRDLNSSNGIKVNGARCAQNWLLPGDEVAIARHRFEVKYVAVGPVPAPLNDFDPSVSLMEKAGLSRRAVEMREGEDISMSLMEKAGLDRGPRSPLPRRGTPTPAPTRSNPNQDRDSLMGDPTPPPRPKGQKKPESDESIAMKWLEPEE